MGVGSKGEEVLKKVVVSVPGCRVVTPVLVLGVFCFWVDLILFDLVKCVNVPIIVFFYF